MLVADGGLEPLAALLDVDRGEAGDLGCAGTGGRRDRCAAHLERRLRAEETQAIDLDRDRAAGIVGERCGVLVADGGAALGPLAALVDNDRRLCVRGGGGGGVAGVERLDERIEKRLDRLLVVASTSRGSPCHLRRWRFVQSPDLPEPASSTPGRSGPSRSHRSPP